MTYGEADITSAFLTESLSPAKNCWHSISLYTRYAHHGGIPFHCIQGMHIIVVFHSTVYKVCTSWWHSNPLNTRYALHGVVNQGWGNELRVG